MTTLFLQQLNAHAKIIEQALDDVLSDPCIPERLCAAMRHGALGRGKRLRPFLVIETAALFDISLPAALPAALALECVHCYSLIHDDLPAMDNDDMRRGQPTVHRAFDEASAILAGDALLTIAFSILAASQAAPHVSCCSKLVGALAEAAGARGMIAGQILDLAAEGRYTQNGLPLALTPEAVRDLQFRKTGALIGFAVTAGAILGQASSDHLLALQHYARALGLAFQIADDLLDAEGSVEELGKAVGKDAAAGKATLVSLLGLEAARAECASSANSAHAALAPFGARADMLHQAIDFVIQRRF